MPRNQMITEGDLPSDSDTAADDEEDCLGFDPALLQGSSIPMTPNSGFTLLKSLKESLLEEYKKSKQAKKEDQ